MKPSYGQKNFREFRIFGYLLQDVENEATLWNPKHRASKQDLAKNGHFSLGKISQ
jgi:hypothetical protein